MKDKLATTYYAFAIAASVGMAALATTSLTPAFTNEAEAENTLSRNGFKNIETGGGTWTGTLRDGVVRTQFNATNSAGEPVSGFVGDHILMEPKIFVTSGNNAFVIK